MKVLVYFALILGGSLAFANPFERIRGRGWRRRFTSSPTVTRTTSRPTQAPRGQGSGDNMPQRKILNFRMGGKMMELNLEKSDRVTADTPIIEIDKLNVHLKEEWGDKEKFAVYQDRATQASIIMQKRKKPFQNIESRQSQEDIQYAGFFKSDGKVYEIKMQEERSTTGDDPRRSPDGSGSVTTVIDNQMYDIYPTSEYDYPKEERVFMKEGFNDYMNYKKFMLMVSKDLSSSRLAEAGQVRKDYYVEQMIVLDYSIYSKYLRLANNDEVEAVRLMHIYYAHVVNGIDMRYNSIESDEFRIFIRLAYIVIAKTSSDSFWTEAPGIKEGGVFTNAYRSLDSFEEWLELMSLNLPPYDQASLFTSNKLFSYRRDDGSYRTISGLADIMGICQSCQGRAGYCGASVNHDLVLYSSIQTGAHELGHNLGSFHDGNSQFASTCSGSDQFIMASSPRLLTDDIYKNAYTFSSCSVKQFKEHLAFLTMTNQNCLENQADHFDRDLFTYLLQQTAGQVLMPDQQCQLAYGDGSFYCGGGTRDERICREMQCWDPSRSRCVTERDTAELRAADGTTCGNQKICQEGDCIPSKTAPAAPERCIYGDYKGEVIREPSLTCRLMVQNEPWRCYDDFYNLECCESCEKIEQEKYQGCEYGDRSPPFNCDRVRSTPRDCYDTTTSNVCCGSCSAIARPELGKGCEYGNHASWCSTIYRRNCYVDGDTCCETCARLKTGPTGCEYGDKISWCPGIFDRDCYREDYKERCCDTCERRKTGPKGCEWGDRVPSCHISECANPDRLEKCCHTCASFITPTTLPPTTVTTTLTTTTPTPTTTLTLPVNPMCPDKADYCADMPGMDCYYYEDTCCDRCSQLVINVAVPGCKYGDHVKWCKSYLSTTPNMCDSDYIKDLCCFTCESISGATPSTTPQPECKDSSSWCSASNFNPGWCYSSSTAKTCCATCKSLESSKPGCKYGDKYSWCKPIYCANHKDDCCASCP